MDDNNIVDWEFVAPAVNVSVEEIDHFDARGKLHVFGRGDYFGRYRRFHFDMWKTSNGQFLMRCWSRCHDIDWMSFEIKGLDPATIPMGNGTVKFEDSWIPKAVRNAYECWIEREF